MSGQFVSNNLIITLFVFFSWKHQLIIHVIKNLQFCMDRSFLSSNHNSNPIMLGLIHLVVGILNSLTFGSSLTAPVTLIKSFCVTSTYFLYYSLVIAKLSPRFNWLDWLALLSFKPSSPTHRALDLRHVLLTMTTKIP